VPAALGATLQAANSSDRLSWSVGSSRRCQTPLSAVFSRTSAAPRPRHGHMSSTLFFPTATHGFHPFITEGCYRTLLYPPSFPTHHLLNVSIRIANKLGNLKKKTYVLVHSANCVKTRIQWHVEGCSLALLCN
jgi:hypothetical protein